MPCVTRLTIPEISQRLPEKGSSLLTSESSLRDETKAWINGSRALHKMCSVLYHPVVDSHVKMPRLPNMAVLIAAFMLSSPVLELIPLSLRDGLLLVQPATRCRHSRLVLGRRLRW